MDGIHQHGNYLHDFLEPFILLLKEVRESHEGNFHADEYRPFGAHSVVASLKLG
jgi:hypothetical protein